MKFDFSDIYNNLNAACIEAGTTLTEVCRQAKVNRSTPERWKTDPPKTLVMISKMLAEIEKAKKKKGKKHPKIMPGIKNLTRKS